MYDKKRDCIIVSTSPSTCRIEMNHDMLEDLREALGLDKKGNQKFTINILDNCDGYLNLDSETKQFIISDSGEHDGWKTHFTLNEINDLKQRDDLAIDWDNAIINHVED